jgi:hypothetical protein
MTPEIRPKDIRDIKEGINQEGREPLGCDSSRVSDHAVALRILQHEFGELTLPGEVEEMLLVRSCVFKPNMNIFGKLVFGFFLA